MKPASFFQSKRFLTYAFGALFIISAFLRFYQLNLPKDKVFDEVYFPVFAENYLSGTDFFDAHPPLGKLIIAGGIASVGNNPLGWRIMNALTGLVLLGVVAGFTYSLTQKWSAAFWATALVAIDPMALIESRIGLINIYLALFSLVGLWFFWRWWQKDQKTSDLTIACLAFGLAASVKWIGLGTFVMALIFVIVARILNLAPPLKWKPHQLACFVLIPLAYALTFIPDVVRGQDIMWWHNSAFSYHSHLTATHPYGSNWWSWALSARPVWLYYQVVNAKVIGIIEIGNIVTWIGGLTVFLATVFASSVLFIRKKLDKKTAAVLLYLSITYLGLYLPWIVISRVKFVYHYFVPVILLLIFTGIIFDTWINEKSPNRVWAWVIFMGGLAFFLYFLPLLLGIPISQEFYQQHMWFRAWI